MQNELSVLVADDELDIRRELAERLKAEKVKVRLARNGKEALKLVQKHSIDVAVLDIKMKGNGNGIETAAKIQKKHPNMPILFLTAYNDADNRSRSAEAKVRVKRWIDKGPDWLEIATSAVLETLNLKRISLVRQSIWQWAQEEQIEKEKIERLETRLSPYTFGFPPVPTPIRPPGQPASAPPPDSVPSTLEEVLAHLRILLDETRLGYSDVAHRHLSWNRSRKVVSDHLWAACESLKEDKYRQQLTDQLDVAVGKIEPHQLLPEHLDAVALSLERLSSDKVGPNDVHDCEKAWRLSEVETLPSFSEILKNWQEWYRVGDEDDEKESAARDDDTTASRSR